MSPGFDCISLVNTGDEHFLISLLFVIFVPSFLSMSVYHPYPQAQDQIPGLNVLPLS